LTQLCTFNDRQKIDFSNKYENLYNVAMQLSLPNKFPKLGALLILRGSESDF